MSKKPRLTLINPTASGVSPAPSELGNAGRALWASVMDEYQINDAGGIEMLKQCCLAADRAAACRAQIDRDGELIQTKTGYREHPLLKAELASMAFVTWTLQRLGLNLEPVRPLGGRLSQGLGS